MTLLASWQAEIRALIPRGFLRPDQACRCLFLSDYPRWEDAGKITAALLAKGYRVIVDKGLALIDGTEEKYRSLLNALPCPAVSPTEENVYALSLARRLIRTDTPLNGQNLAPAAQLIRWLNGGHPQALSRFSALAAQCQRRHIFLPAAAGNVILCYLSELQGGKSPC